MPEERQPQFEKKQPPPLGLLVLGIAEVPAPEDSIIWSLLEQSVRQLNQRGPTQGLLIEPLKLRSLSHHVVGLAAQSHRVVILEGQEGGTAGNRCWARQRLTSRTEPGESPLLKTIEPLVTPAGEPVEGFDPVAQLRAANGEEDPDEPTADDPGLPSWFAGSMPPGGVDLITLALPARGGLAWVLPQIGIWFPETVQRLSDLLWEIGQETVDPGASGRGPGAVA